MKAVRKTIKKKDRSNAGDFNLRIDSQSKDPFFYYKRGVEWSQKGLYDLALADFTRAISLKEDFARAYYGRGTVYNSMKEYEKAEEDFQRSHHLMKSLHSREDHIRRN